MLKTAFRWLVTIIAVLFVVYLLLPSPEFPSPPDDAQQSKEPGDVLELEVRRSYFTDWPRAEVMAHYQDQFKNPWLSFIPTYRLNYPPEEALWYVYDPLKSTYLEEIVFPFRESIYVNGYEPGEKDDKIAFEGQPYFSKLTVKYYTSPLWARLVISAATMLVVAILWKKWVEELGDLFQATWSGLFKKKKATSSSS